MNICIVHLYTEYCKLNLAQYELNLVTKELNASIYCMYKLNASKNVLNTSTYKIKPFTNDLQSTDVCKCLPTYELNSFTYELSP